MKRLIELKLLLLSAVMFFATSAIAETIDPYNPGDDPEYSFAELITYPDTIDNPHPIFKLPLINETATYVLDKIKEKEGDDEIEYATRLTNGLDAIRAIVNYSRNQLDSDMDVEKNLLGAIDNLWKQYSGSINHDILLKPNSWKVDAGSFTASLNSEFGPLNYQTAYLEKLSQNPEFYQKAVDSVAITLLVHRTLNYVYRKESVGKIGNVARARMKQWDTYFNNSIPQWPWELALVNGPIYNSYLKNEKGLGKVPEWQLIVLHPDIVVEYMPEAEDGSQFEPALLIEVIGANFWSWESDGDQTGPGGLPIPIGAGFVTTFTDRADTDDWGFGGVIHFNHIYNVGVTFREGDPSYFVSLNISKLLENKSSKAKKYLDMVGL